MKVKTNVRAGKQNRKNSGAEAPETETPSYVPPVSRCPGI